MWNIFGSKHFRWKTVGLNEIPCNFCYFSRMGDLGGLRKQIHQHLSFEQPQFSQGAWSSESKRQKYYTLQWTQASRLPAFESPVVSRTHSNTYSTLVQIRPALHHFWYSVHLCHKNSLHHILSPHFQYFESFPESKPLLSSPLSRTPRRQRDKRVRFQGLRYNQEAAFLE